MPCEQICNQRRSLIPDIPHHADRGPAILVHVRRRLHQLSLESLSDDLKHLIASHTGDDSVEHRDELVWVIVKAHADLDLRSALKREVTKRNQGRPATVVNTFLKVAKPVCGLDIDGGAQPCW